MTNEEESCSNDELIAEMNMKQAHLPLNSTMKVQLPRHLFKSVGAAEQMSEIKLPFNNRIKRSKHGELLCEGEEGSSNQSSSPKLAIDDRRTMFDFDLNQVVRD